MRADGNLHRGASGMRFAISVDETGCGTLDEEACAPPPPHPRAVVEGAEEKPRHQRQRAEETSRLHHHEVEQAVVNAGAGGEAGIVPILIGIGDGDDEGVESFALAAAIGDHDPLTTMVEKRLESGARVGGKAAAGEAVETVADFGVEAEAHDIEERVAVGRASVDGGNAGGRISEERERLAWLGGQTEVACEAVAGAGGYEREHSRRADQRLGHLVHRAIAADNDHPIAAVRQRTPGQFGGMAGTAGENEAGIEPVFRDERPDDGDQPGSAAVPAGVRIEDEARLHATAMTAGVTAAASKRTAMAWLASGWASGARAARHWRQTAPRSAKALCSAVTTASGVSTSAPTL